MPDDTSEYTECPACEGNGIVIIPNTQILPDVFNCAYCEGTGIMEYQQAVQYHEDNRDE
jgi:excinuclease UvrABC ATPase subunit